MRRVRFWSTPRRPISAFALLGLLPFGVGCSSLAESSGADPRVGREWVTRRTLVRGSDWGFKLFGLFPFVSPSFGDATAELYQRAALPMDGRAITPVNVVRDHGTIWCLLFSLPHVGVTADLVELLPLRGSEATPPNS